MSFTDMPSGATLPALDASFVVVVHEYIGAPVCKKCWDETWRKTEDGINDPLFDKITHTSTGEWL